jgi:hypothetical protein
MSEVLQGGEPETIIKLVKEEGAIIVREDGVELLLPDIDQELPLPKHLVPLMALAMIIGDEKRLQEAIDHMYAIMDKQEKNV